jgi:hypothetical protein
MSQPLTVDVLKTLFAEFNRLPYSHISEPTFMEITGYPHYENVCSNIFQFYLQPQNPHGLESLFLEGLCALSLDHIPPDLQSAEIQREVITTTGNRIDLVIETASIVIGIENKVFHGVHNNLVDYWDYLETISRGRTVHGVLLSLYPVETHTPLHKFKVISYQQYFSYILNAMGKYLLGAKEPYLTFFRDFVQTLENLRRGSAVNAELLAYLRDNEAQIVALLSEINGLRDEMRRKIKVLGSLIQLDELKSVRQVQQWFYREPTGLFDVLVHDIDLDTGVVVAIDTILRLSGWQILLYNRRGTRGQIETWLNQHNIRTTKRAEGEWRLVYGDNQFAYDSDVGNIQSQLQDLLGKFASK